MGYPVLQNWIHQIRTSFFPNNFNQLDFLLLKSKNLNFLQNLINNLEMKNLYQLSCSKLKTKVQMHNFQKKHPFLYKTLNSKYWVVYASKLETILFKMTI